MKKVLVVDDSLRQPASRLDRRALESVVVWLEIATEHDFVLLEEEPLSVSPGDLIF